eukprot:6016133-Pleurochrysis_carterae.AAC.4
MEAAKAAEVVVVTETEAEAGVKDLAKGTEASGARIRAVPTPSGCSATTEASALCGFDLNAALDFLQSRLDATRISLDQHCRRTLASASLARFCYGDSFHLFHHQRRSRADAVTRSHAYAHAKCIRTRARPNA